jgi:hypothetical protein
VTQQRSFSSLIVVQLRLQRLGLAETQLESAVQQNHDGTKLRPKPGSF